MVRHDGVAHRRPPATSGHGSRNPCLDIFGWVDDAWGYMLSRLVPPLDDVWAWLMDALPVAQWISDLKAFNLYEVGAGVDTRACGTA